MNTELDEEEVIEFPADLVEVQDRGLTAKQLEKKKAEEEKQATNIGLDQFEMLVRNAWVRNREWKKLKNETEHARLHRALMKLKSS